MPLLYRAPEVLLTTSMPYIFVFSYWKPPVSINIVGREYRLPNGDLVCDKGKFEEWLDLPQFSDTDKLKRLYCWLVGYLENPREYETLFTKRY